MTVDANLIQGNLAGAGDGGGIKVLWSLPADLMRIANNFIVNNVAGLAGGGIALQDAASVADRAQHDRAQRLHGHGRSGVHHLRT